MTELECTSNLDCSENEFCDLSDNICKLKVATEPEGIVCSFDEDNNDAGDCDAHGGGLFRNEVFCEQPDPKKGVTGKICKTCKTFGCVHPILYFIVIILSLFVAGVQAVGASERNEKWWNVGGLFIFFFVCCLFLGLWFFRLFGRSSGEDNTQKSD